MFMFDLFRSVSSRILTGNSHLRLALLIACDASVASFVFFISVALRLGDFGNEAISRAAPGVAIFLSSWMVSALSLNYYRSSFRFFSGYDVVLIGKITAAQSVILVIVFGLLGVSEVPRTVAIIAPLLNCIAMVLVRYLVSLYMSRGVPNEPSQSVRPFIVISTFQSVYRLLSQIDNIESMRTNFEVIAALTLDESVVGRLVNGVPVFAFGFAQLVSIRETTGADLAVISGDVSLDGKHLDLLLGAGFQVKRLNANLDQYGEQPIADLSLPEVINRTERLEHLPEVNPWTNRTVVVTGSGGSIGSELVRQIASAEAAKIILIEHSEVALHNIVSDLLANQGSSQYVPILADCSDRLAMEQVFKKYRPDVVFHAAAYKHVYLVEQNAVEGFRNNVLSTLILTDLCRENSISNFILISSDKAVRPTNVMGATKRVCELIVGQQFRDIPSCRAIAVRFGNVFGSSGSVVTIFQKQIQSGGPLTVTDKRATRFFMSISEAVRLVLCSACVGRTGDVMLLDMGDPVNIYELATRMIQLERARNPRANPMQIKLTGLSAGEKLHEEMWISNSARPTVYEKVLREALFGDKSIGDCSALMAKVRKFEATLDRTLMINVLNEYVEGFSMDPETADRLNAPIES
jgi:FlaA1/EpsC-like NDP-sugar epimerase